MDEAEVAAVLVGRQQRTGVEGKGKGNNKLAGVVFAVGAGVEVEVGAVDEYEDEEDVEEGGMWCKLLAPSGVVEAVDAIQRNWSVNVVCYSASVIERCVVVEVGAESNHRC